MHYVVMGRAISGIVALGLFASHALPCCLVSPGEEVLMTHENVIIVWDEKAQMQHFIRQANFKSKAKEFGFIVPTPTEPDFSVANEKAFSKLQNLVPVDDTRKAASADATTATAGVEVLKTEQVGDYEATVVKATDGAVLNAWLKENGFISRPAMTEWLDGYAKKQWVFTALKYKADEDLATETNAIRISFKTDRPHYPYKMPKDTWPEGHVRPLKLYFVAAHAINAKYVDTNDHWEATKQWSGPLPVSQRAGLAKELGLLESDLPKDAQVTIFENRRNNHGYDQDLTFASSTNYGPFLGGGIALVLFTGWLVIQRNRRRFVPVPA